MQRDFNEAVGTGRFKRSHFVPAPTSANVSALAFRCHLGGDTRAHGRARVGGTVIDKAPQYIDMQEPKLEDELLGCIW